MTENRHADSSKIHGENAYSHQLIETLLKSLAPEKETYPLQACVDSFPDDKLVKAFPFYPGADQVKRTKRWLKQEISKWRKTPEKAFSATLQKLYIYCVLTNLTPNDVLIPGESQPICFLSIDYIIQLMHKLKANNLPIHKSKQGYALPVIFDIFNMSFGVLHIYHRVDSTFGDDLIMRFSTTVLEPHSPDEKTGGLTTFGFEEINLTRNSERECCRLLRITHNELLAEFSSYSDYVHQGIRDFYSEIDGFSDEEMITNLMFSWYPPIVTEPTREPERKDFSSMLSTHTLKSHEREHER